MFFFSSLSCWCVSTQYSQFPVSQGDKILPHGASNFVREGKTKLRPEIRGQRSWGDAATFLFFLSSNTGAAAKNWVIAEGHCDDINVYTHTPTHTRTNLRPSGGQVATLQVINRSRVINLLGWPMFVCVFACTSLRPIPSPSTATPADLPNRSVS